MENKFKKGLILGGILAVGAVVGFIINNGGKEMSEQVQKDLKTIAKLLKKDLSKLEDVTKENFYDLVTKVIEEYSKKKELLEDDKKVITDALKNKWHEMEVEYLVYKDDALLKDSFKEKRNK